MKVLAIDLGRTTGYAYLVKNRVKTFGTFTDVDEGYVGLRTLGEPNFVIVEKPILIRGPLGDEMAALIARTEAEYGNTIEYVTAAQWKPHPITHQARKKLKGYSEHEKDAICIGLWFWWTRLQVEA